MILFAASDVGPVTAALIGAGGAVVGGLLTSLSNLGLEARRAKRDRETASERERREMRIAARLVREELDNARELVADAIESGAYRTTPDRQLATAARTDLRAVLAGDPDDIRWAVVATAFAEMNRLNWVVLERHKQLRGNVLVTTEESVHPRVEREDRAQDALDRIESAREALEGFAMTTG
jgi:hypothetical protein